MILKCIWASYLFWEKFNLWWGLQSRPSHSGPSGSGGIYVMCFSPGGNQKHMMLFSLWSLWNLPFFVMGLILWTGMRESVSTTQCPLTVFFFNVLFKSPSYMENQKVWRGGNSPGREVKGSHGTLHHLIRLILYSPVKWSHVIQYPWGRILEIKQIKWQSSTAQDSFFNSECSKWAPLLHCFWNLRWRGDRLTVVIKHKTKH